MKQSALLQPSPVIAKNEAICSFAAQPSSLRRMKQSALLQPSLTSLRGTKQSALLLSPSPVIARNEAICSFEAQPPSLRRMKQSAFLLSPSHRHCEE
jgi:hypothetical protein